jgi:hypothetical protein
MHQFAKLVKSLGKPHMCRSISSSMAAESSFTWVFCLPKSERPSGGGEDRQRKVGKCKVNKVQGISRRREGFFRSIDDFEGRSVGESQSSSSAPKNNLCTPCKKKKLLDGISSHSSMLQIMETKFLNCCSTLPEKEAERNIKTFPLS